jgi:hypothetical protein
VHDRSGSVFDTLEVLAIPSTTSLQLSAVPTFVIAGGVDYLVLTPYVTGLFATGTTVSGYALTEMAVTVVANGTGSSSGMHNNTPRWR